GPRSPPSSKGSGGAIWKTAGLQRPGLKTSRCRASNRMPSIPSARGGSGPSQKSSSPAIAEIREGWSMADTHDIVEPLTKLVRAKTADARARVTDVQALPGHAGFGYSFLLERGSAAAKPSGKLVLRVAPEGVRISG